MIHDSRFAKYVSVRKVTPREIEEDFAYENAVVTTTVTGIKGLVNILNAQFSGEDFSEQPCEEVVDSDYEQLLNGYVSYCTQIDYVERVDEHEKSYAAREEWGGMHKYA